MPSTILLMDNIKETLDKWGSLLEEVGYRVVKVSTLEEAENVLTNKWVHLAILDIRMVAEEDENDISGLLLAQKPEYAAVPKIVLTAYPSFEYARLILAPNEQGRRPAINFIAKDEGPQALLEAIRLAFTNEVHINWNLDIQWDRLERLSFPHLVNLIQVGLPNHLLVHRAEELEDLIRKLFYQYQQIRIGRLLWQEHKRFCVSVLTRSLQGMTDSRLLICGERDSLELEWEQTSDLVSKIKGGIVLDAQTQTMHFGAYTCVFPHTDIENIQTLRLLFQVGKERPLKTAVDHLTGDVLKPWHLHGKMLNETSDLMAFYRQVVGLSDDEGFRRDLEQRLSSLVQSVRLLNGVEISRDNKETVFQLPQQPPLYLADPVKTVYAPLAQYSAPVVCIASPGRITADNVLVDATQKTWLTDFALAGQAPQWWDFVCLEATIRFELSKAPDLLAWQEFETRLVRPTRLDEKLEQNDVIPELRTSIALIEQVRKYAADETGGEILPYNAGLLAWAVEAIAHFDPSVLYTQADRLRSAHLLLAASMIANQLYEAPALLPSGETLKLDDDGTVWLGNRRVASLMGLELDLLRYLYEHTEGGRLASRKDIVKSVYQEEFDPHDKSQDQRLTALVSRLRDKIEPYPARPRYLITSRGGGYRLYVNGESDG